MSFIVNSEKHPGKAPCVTEDTKRMLKERPRFFRGNPYITNGLIMTDKEVEEFKERAYSIKLK